MSTSLCSFLATPNWESPGVHQYEEKSANGDSVTPRGHPPQGEETRPKTGTPKPHVEQDKPEWKTLGGHSCAF